MYIIRKTCLITVFGPKINGKIIDIAITLIRKSYSHLTLNLHSPTFLYHNYRVRTALTHSNTKCCVPAIAILQHRYQLLHRSPKVQMLASSHYIWSFCKCTRCYCCLSQIDVPRVRFRILLDHLYLAISREKVAALGILGLLFLPLWAQR